MHGQNTEKQRMQTVRQVIMLLCVCILFLLIGVVFFITPRLYAQQVKPSDNGYMPFDVGTATTVPITIPTTVPPTTIPTTVPTVVPTTAPPPLPTSVPTTPPAPVTQPTAVPPAPTLTVPNPVGTSVGGVPPVPPPGPGDPGQQPLPTPSPTKIMPTPTRGVGTPVPVATAVSTAATALPKAASISTPSTNPTLTMMQTGLFTAVAILLGGTALVGMMWRQKRVRFARQVQQQQSPPQFPQVVMPEAYTAPAQSFALANGMQREFAPIQSSPAPLPTSPTQQSIEEIWEHSPIFQEARLNGSMMPPPETPRSPNETAMGIDPLLEKLIRQAQMGLFALPDK